MVHEFKKIGVAAAVAGALAASGAAQALTLGEPGGALLVPHVLYDSAAQVNTMVGITTGDFVPSGQYDTVSGEGKGCEGGLKQLHWYFFSKKSVHLADGTIKVSCNDFARLDWGYIITNPNRPFPSLNGVTGYLVISSNDTRTDNTPSNYTLYGSSYLIQGNWASEAFIPVLPLRDSEDSSIDEVKYAGNIPKQVNPVAAGMPLADHANKASRFSLRYFLGDAGLEGSTRWVFWFPDNSGDVHGNGKINRAAVPVDIYDADEVAISTTVALPDELNIIDASKVDGTFNDPTAHAITEITGMTPAKNTGFVLFQLADTSNTATGSQYSRAGVAFSLIGIGGANASQVQTDLAHERGIISAP